MSYELGVEGSKKEIEKLKDLISRINEKEKELKKVRKELTNKEKGLEDNISNKRDALTEQEAKELLLEKFFSLIDEQLTKYLNTEKKEVIKIFENLWDKYKVSLNELKQERDEEIKKLDKFLEKLGYLSYE